jgi:hypothetical protein
VEQDLMLAAAVRDWVESRWPGARDLGEHAATVAARAREGGASVAEACGEVRQLAGCWLRHPSSQGTRYHLPVAS